MKRLIIILLLSVLVAAGAFGQSLTPPEYALGVKGGLTWSFLRSDPSISQPKMPMGVNAGIQYRMILERYFGLWIEVNYEQRGFQDRIDGLDYRRQMDYIEMPFLAHFTFGKKMFRFYFNLGPSIAVMIRDVENSGSGALTHQLPVAHRFDYGLTGGVGFELNTVAGIYTIGGRYNFGMGNIFERQRVNGYVLSSNQNISVSFGWMWKFKNKQKSKK